MSKNVWLFDDTHQLNAKALAALLEPLDDGPALVRTDHPSGGMDRNTVYVCGGPPVGGSTNFFRAAFYEAIRQRRMVEGGCALVVDTRESGDLEGLRARLEGFGVEVVVMDSIPALDSLELPESLEAVLGGGHPPEDFARLFGRPPRPPVPQVTCAIHALKPPPDTRVFWESTGFPEKNRRKRERQNQRDRKPGGAR